jgi:hypothetical protein
MCALWHCQRAEEMMGLLCPLERGSEVVKSRTYRRRNDWKGAGRVGLQQALGRRNLGTRTAHPYRPSVARCRRAGREPLCASVISDLSRRRHPKRFAVLGVADRQEHGDRRSGAGAQIASRRANAVRQCPSGLSHEQVKTSLGRMALLFNHRGTMNTEISNQVQPLISAFIVSLW